jgi:hypothetical protein
MRPSDRLKEIDRSKFITGREKEFYKLALEDVKEELEKIDFHVDMIYVMWNPMKIPKPEDINKKIKQLILSKISSSSSVETKQGVIGKINDSVCVSPDKSAEGEDTVKGCSKRMESSYCGYIKNDMELWLCDECKSKIKDKAKGKKRQD